MNSLANQVIDLLDGTNAVAKIFDIKPSSVSEWRVTGIPKARLQYLRLAHPEAFDGLETEQSQPDKVPS